MKRSALPLFIILCVGGYCVARSHPYLGAKFISSEQAEQRWGRMKFVSANFRAAKPDARAAYAVDILARRLFVGADRSEVRKELGVPDGYFFSDAIYAYKIDTLESGSKEAWQLIFVPDSTFEKVGDVRIHKRCCD